MTPPELLEDLGNAGVEVPDIWDLVNGDNKYDPAIPVLIDWLSNLEARVATPDQPKLREALVRALSIPAAKPGAAPVMVDQFKRVEDPSGLGQRWVIGNALSIVADDSVFDDLEVLARDVSYGKSRQMIVIGLGKSKNQRAVPLLVELLGDEDIAAHAVMALGKLKDPRARSAIEPLLDCSQTLVRREAKKALARLPS